MSKPKVEKHVNQKSGKSSNNPNQLQFTGNWFIDAGILGFVNLMEEVYGWDLEKLRERISEEPEVVYYGYFPFAYFYNLSKKDKKELKTEAISFIEKNKELGKKILEEVWWKFITELFRESWVEGKLKVMHESECYDKRGKVKPQYADSRYRNLVKEREELIVNILKNNNFKEKIEEVLGKRKELIKEGSHNLTVDDIRRLEENLGNFTDDDLRKEIENIIRKHKELENYLNKIWDVFKAKNISKDKSVFYRIPIDSSFFKNYLFFNNSKGIFEQLEDLKNLLDGNTNYSEYLSKIDKTISKFLPSDEEFPNISYTKFRAETILKDVPYLFVYLINFLNAFVNVRGIGNVFFYSNDLDFTYQINKKIRVYIKDSDNNLKILRLTWQAIIDTLVETETTWVLENMYLIRYKSLSQQDLIGVEYIGILKLQASIILDDTIRDTINRNIAVKASNGKIEQQVWLLEEFIKQKPLLPHLINNIHLYLADNIKYEGFISMRTLVYASIVDAKVKEFGNDNRLFGDHFFNSYRQLLSEIKNDVRRASGAVRAISETLEDSDERKSYANLLLSAIRRDNKHRFVNTVLKALVEKKGEEKVVKTLMSFIFDKILSNDLSWKNYALILVGGLIGGGEADGEE
uniref:Uncharacterized protein n=1 Tax=Thermodesulfobacterium geofontis TaxID=1295609 RepID=A0A7C4JS24_9BACT